MSEQDKRVPRREMEVESIAHLFCRTERFMRIDECVGEQKIFRGLFMTDTQLLDRITVNPKVMAGKPVIRGTRLPVEFICRRIARGTTLTELLHEYNGLLAEDVLACLLYPRENPAMARSKQAAAFDLGHQEEVDYTQILKFLALTPDERLERHEEWRLFVKEALRNARIRQGDDSATDPSAG